MQKILIITLILLITAPAFAATYLLQDKEKNSNYSISPISIETEKEKYYHSQEFYNRVISLTDAEVDTYFDSLSKVYNYTFTEYKIIASKNDLELTISSLYQSIARLDSIANSKAYHIIKYPKEDILSYHYFFSYSNLANCYYKMHAYEMAKSYFDKAKNYMDDITNLQRFALFGASAWNNYELKLYTNTVDDITMALSLAEQDEKIEKLDKYMMYRIRGNCYLANNQKQLTLNDYYKAQEQCKIHYSASCKDMPMIIRIIEGK